MKLVKCQCNKDIKKYYFSHRVVSKWNMLDNDSVMAKTVNGFKTKLERGTGKEDGSVFGLMSASLTEFWSGHSASLSRHVLDRPLHNA